MRNVEEFRREKDVLLHTRTIQKRNLETKQSPGEKYSVVHIPRLSYPIFSYTFLQS